MYLYSQTKKYKDKIYNYYSIAESYRDEKGVSRKKILFRLGKLSDSTAEKIQQILALKTSDEAIVMSIDKLLFNNHWQYLDIAFLHQIWDRWGIDRIISGTDNEVRTNSILEILTISRCLSPSSIQGTVEWFPKTILPWILKVNPEDFTKDRIWRELKIIEALKPSLEKYLIDEVKKCDPNGMKNLYYHLSGLFFEGSKGSLEKPRRVRSDGFKENPITLAIATNEHGYPLMWDVLESAILDVETLEYLVNKCNDLEETSSTTLVLDGNMVSNKNLKNIENKSIKYISTLDKDQILGIIGESLQGLGSIDSNNLLNRLKKSGFTKFDDLLFYKDLHLINNRRYVLGINPHYLQEEYCLREKLLDETESLLLGLNHSLKNAKRSRKKMATEKKVEEILKKRKSSILIDWHLEPITVENITTRKGVEYRREVSTFQVQWRRLYERIPVKELLDGIYLFVSNHIEKIGGHFAFSGESIINAYFYKNEVDDTIRGIKSFLDFPLVYNDLEDHVRAHDTISILSYLLNITVRNQLRKSNIIENSHSHLVYSQLGECTLSEIAVKGIKKTTLKLRTPNDKQKTILKEFGYEFLLKKDYLNKVVSGRIYPS